MQDQTIETQTRIYVYDLMNEAKEHGFKDEDRWELSMVTEAERTRIQRNYYPAVASKAFPDMLLHVFQSVKSRLKQSLSKAEQLMDSGTIARDDLKYIIAFNPKRIRG